MKILNITNFIFLYAGLSYMYDVACCHHATKTKSLKVDFNKIQLFLSDFFSSRLSGSK